MNPEELALVRSPSKKTNPLFDQPLRERDLTPTPPPVPVELRMVRLFDTTDGFGRSGKVTTTTRLGNVVLVVDYQGATHPTDSVGAIDMERATPLDEKLARAAARTVAQDLVAALARHG